MINDSIESAIALWSSQKIQEEIEKLLSSFTPQIINGNFNASIGDYVFSDTATSLILNISPMMKAFMEQSNLDNTLNDARETLISKMQDEQYAKALKQLHTSGDIFSKICLDRGGLTKRRFTLTSVVMIIV